MRIFLFKLIYRLAAWVFPCGARSSFIRKHCEDQIHLYNKDKAMNACIRPRSYPKVKGMSRYTDYYDNV